MSDNNNKKYLKYAVGEIALVVVGILIALQINNWNENYKRHKLKSNYINSLLEDLSMDSIKVADQIRFYKQDTADIKETIQRLRDYPDLDTLKHIARNEFKTEVQIITSFNNKTYNTLINTGNIDLFESDLVEELSNLDQFQKLAVRVYELSMNSYSNNLLTYRQKFSLYDDALAGIPLDPIWDDITYKELMPSFNQIITAKLTTGNNVLQFLPQYLTVINDLSNRIKNQFEIAD